MPERQRRVLYGPAWSAADAGQLVVEEVGVLAQLDEVPGVRVEGDVLVRHRHPLPHRGRMALVVEGDEDQQYIEMVRTSPSEP